MKKTAIFTLSLLVFLAASSAVFAAERQSKVCLYYSRSTTKLDGPKMTESLKWATGKDVYENDGDYMGVFFEIPLKYQRFGIYGSYEIGTSDKIDGGNFTDPNYNWMDPNTTKNANPLTNEKAVKLDLMGTFSVFNFDTNGLSGNVDVMFGYFNLSSNPDTSNNNVFAGLEYGLKGFCEKQMGDHGIAVDVMVSYVPSFDVSGNVEGTLDDDSVLQYRISLEYSIFKRYGINLGYQEIRVKGPVIGTGTDSVVTFGGPYIGALLKF